MASERLSESLRDYAARVIGRKVGCIDGSCVWGAPMVHTNKGCACAEVPMEWRPLARMLAKVLNVAWSELRELRTTSLNADEREALEWMRGELMTGNELPPGAYTRDEIETCALAALAKLLARGGERL